MDFIFDFMNSVVDSGDISVIAALREAINTKADSKDDYLLFHQNGDPLTLAVSKNNTSLVEFIAERAPQFIIFVHNADRGGCQDTQILDYAKDDAMKALLIKLGANVEVSFSDNGWLLKTV